MKVQELLDATRGEKSADYDVVIEEPGALARPARLWTLASVRRDTANKRIVLQADSVVEEAKK